VTGMTVRSAAGEMLTAPAVDSVNTVAAPTTVAPRPATANIDAGRVIVNAAPKSVTVVAVRP